MVRDALYFRSSIIANKKEKLAFISSQILAQKHNMTHNRET